MTRAIDNDDNNGIIKCNIFGEEYTFWTHVDFIESYIKDNLKKIFPGKLIVKELNKIDLSIPKDNLPIEIQSTVMHGTRVSYAHWENAIRKQIEQNVINYGRCWFFFDSEFLRAMKNAGRGMSINMIWFRNYMKEEKLKVFVVSHDGIIEEKQYKDFDFLANISQTCSIATETDDMVLNKNKMKIFSTVVEMYDFVQEEIDKFENKFEKFSESDKRKIAFLKICTDKRAKLYGNILHAISNLPVVNDILDLKNSSPTAKSYASLLGIFDAYGRTDNAIAKFVDRSNVCQYFPGYIRNKETWDKLKNHTLNPRQFESIVKNGISNYFWYEDKGDIVTESEQINDKDVNITIESKDQIITVNIKDKTKQENIDDAWSR